MNSYPSSYREWVRRTDRMTPLLWVLVVVDVVAIVLAVWAISKIV